ncbi:MAG: Fic family protein [Candidatus Diapherotrites archaeon]
MKLRTKTIHDKKYYYLDLGYRTLAKSKTFSKYVGTKKPAKGGLAKIGESFRREIILKLAGKEYAAELISKDSVIKALLIRDAFNRKFAALSAVRRRKYEVDSTILFTLSTLTTEEVDVGLEDVRNAFKKEGGFSARERISKNMLNAVESIKEKHALDRQYILGLHKTIMAGFEGKTPGKIREGQVYLQARDVQNPKGREIGYRPPHHGEVGGLLDGFVEWYNSTPLNPVEKAAQAHYRLYKIHPFLDGNKRVCRLILNKALIDEGFPLLNISAKKEQYFRALMDSVEKNTLKHLAEFTLEEYMRQAKEFLKGK